MILLGWGEIKGIAWSHKHAEKLENEVNMKFKG